MDLGDYLYLIIFLGVALFQIVSKSFDKKQNNEQNAEKKKRINNKKKINLNEKDSFFESQDSIQSIEKEDLRSFYQPIQVTDDFLHTEESIHVKNTSGKCELNSLISNLSEKNELKKAFIYSEIFGRKF